MFTLPILALALSLAQQPETNFRLAYVKKQLISNGLSHREVIALFEDKRIQTLPPAKARPVDWPTFTAELLSPSSISRGKDFLKNHRLNLEATEKRFGVENEFIAAIFRIETDFGGNLGSHTTFNVFYSGVLRRNSGKWKGAAENLITLVLYCRGRQIDCFTIKGSYAGAFGIPQFLPVSLKYAIDGDGDGIIDLFRYEDAVPSAANFLAKHGWRENRLFAMARYYGSSRGYPEAASRYADAIRIRK